MLTRYQGHWSDFQGGPDHYEQVADSLVFSHLFMKLLRQVFSEEHDVRFNDGCLAIGRTNPALGQRLDTEEEIIYTRTGIRRHGNPDRVSEPPAALFLP